MQKSLPLDITDTPIKLESYFFPKIIFEANHNVSPDDFDQLIMPKSPCMFTNVTQEDEEGKAWTVLLGVKSDESEECCIKYEIQIFGLFVWTGEETTNKNEIDFRNKAMAVSGASILYGAARDCLRTITAMGPFPVYLLPTVQFSPGQAEKIKRPTKKKPDKK